MSASARPLPYVPTYAVPALGDVPHGAYVQGGRLYLVATFAPYEGRHLPLWARDAVAKGKFSVDEVRLVVCQVMDGKGGYGRKMTVRPPRLIEDWLGWALETPIDDQDKRTNPYTGEVAMLALGAFLPEMHMGRELHSMGVPECAALATGCTPAEAHALIRAASRDIVEAWVPEWTMSLAGHLAKGGNYPAGVISDWHIPGPGSENFAVAAEQWPCMVPLLLKQRRASLGNRPPSAWLKDDHPIRGPLDCLLLPFLGTWAKPAHLRHLRGVRARPTAQGAAFIGGLPPEWISAGREEAHGRYLVTVANGLGTLAEQARMPSRELVRESKGQWRDYAERLRQAAFPGVGETTVSAVGRHVLDMCEHFHESVVTPCLDRRNHYDGTRTSLHEARTRSFVVASPEAFARTIICMLGTGGMSNLAERSARYTTLGDAIRMCLRETSPHLLSLLGWETALPAWSDEMTGLDLVPLADQDELSAEGRRTPSSIPGAGLAHCVGSYGPRCASGTSRIVSVRRTLPDGFERVSTLEIQWTDRKGDPFAAQHHGRGNREPSLEAIAAAERYVQAIAGCPPPPVVRVASRTRLHAMAERCGYDPTVPANIELALELWRPMLPRTLRHLDADGLATHLLSIELGAGTDDA